MHGKDNDADGENRVLILGASTRAAAYSAVRAGLRPICADLFADDDLCEIAKVLEVARYPHDLARVAEQVLQCPWMYTGAMENHPRLIERISRSRRLWGNGPTQLEAVRDPGLLGKMLESAGLPSLAVWDESNPPPADGSWMLKPRRSAAGRGIVVWDSDNEPRASSTLREPHYFQRRVDGEPVSALYLATRGTTVLVGIAGQLVGDRRLNAPSFAYCGSIGPVALDVRLRTQIERVGRAVAAGCELRGLFGGDFVCDGHSAWLTEVNPRYTASVEVFEHAFDIPLLERHRRACLLFEGHAKVLPVHELERTVLRGPSTVVGKAILYADNDLVAPPLGEMFSDEENSGPPPLVDRPRAGTHIRSGQPVCTVLADGPTVQECQRRLWARVARVQSRLKANSS